MTDVTKQAKLEAALRSYPLEHDEVVTVDINGPTLMPEEAASASYGLRLPVIAELSLAQQRFGIADSRGSGRFGSDLLVVSSLKDTPEGYQGFKGLWPEKPVVLGRSSYADRFKYFDTVSARHVELVYSGLTLVINNLRPTNSTQLTGTSLDTAERAAYLKNIKGDYTILVVKNHQDRYDYGEADTEAPYGYYRNHPIIGRKSTTVRNGIYFTAVPKSEAVVVDDKSRVVRQVTQEFLTAISSKYGLQHTYFETHLLNEIVDYVDRVMPYSLEIADEIGLPLEDNNEIVGLSTYLLKRGGVCRHQCLLAAHLIEALVEKGLLSGTVGVERNIDYAALGGHAWTVFRDFRGKEIIVDPTQHFVGTRERARREGRWRYYLPLDS